MKNYLIAFLLLLALGSSLRADDQIHAAQQALKDQGYYFGDVDGQPGPETSSAIRRFQIRGGLQVTGTLTPETVTSLNGGGEPAPPSARPAPAQHPATAGIADSDKDFLDRTEKREMPPTATPSDTVAPPVNVVPPGAEGYADIFARTPYESAPPEVQRDTLRRAQAKLAKKGYYRGIVDGAPGGGTVRAISAYQSDRELPRTGRLDMQTLSEMDLLPTMKHLQRPPVVSQEPPPGRPIYRGIWVR